MNPIDRSPEGTTQRIEGQRAALMAVLPAELKDREDALPARIRTDNASVQSKLGRIYALVDEFSAHRAPYVACKQGCSDCCRMNVQISNLEAARIAAATGRRARTLPRSVLHENGKFEGEACPFLMDSACSIYEDRPYACRNHASFDVDAYWCAPGRMQATKLPMLELGGARQALVEVLKQTKQPVLADIRDFFPAEGTQ